MPTNEKLDVKKSIFSFAFIAFALLGILFGMNIMSFIFGGFSSISDVQDISSTQIILANNGTETTLSTTLTSFTSATKLNQTWLDFDGDNITFNSFTVPLINSTIHFRYKRNNVTNLDNVLGESSNKNFRFVKFSITDNRLEVETNVNTDIYRGTVSVVDNEWHYYTLVFNNYTGSFYQDNITLLMPSQSSTSNNVTFNLIGLNGDSNLNGSLDNLWIINSSLDADEVDYVFRNNGDLNPSIKIERLGNRYNFYPHPNGNVTGQTKGEIYNSVNNGTTNVLVANLTKQFGYEGIAFGPWMDSRNTTFTTITSSSILFKSVGNITNWTVSLNVSEVSNCKYAVIRSNSLTEDSSGNLYFGTYSSQGDGSQANESCGLIYKSTDNGYSWNNVYNGTNNDGDTQHIHFVQVDPYTGYIYATVGDGDPDAKFIRSIDNGLTWAVLKTGSEDDISWQHTSIAFVSGYRILGEDWNYIGKPNGSSIFRTRDDISFDKVFSTDVDEAGYFSFMKKDANGIIYTGTSEVNNQSMVTLYASNNDGLNWYELYQWNKNGLAGTTGFGMISDFDRNGYVYLFDAKNSSTAPNSLRFKTRLFNESLNLKLNENQGTIAYDVSGNINDGTISGATWNNDGFLITLISGVDYLVASNIFTIINFDLSWEQIVTTFNSLSNREEVSDRITNNSLNSIVTYSNKSNTQFSTLSVAITLVILLAVFAFFWLFFMRKDGILSQSSSIKKGEFT